MNQIEAIESLRKEVSSNPVAKDVFHVFAARQRARNRVSVRALSLRMDKEGFKHDPKEYAAVLGAMHKAGFGQLERNRKGKVTGLKDVRITLQSLGAAVLGQKVKLQNLKDRHHYGTLVSTAAALKEDPKRPVAVYPFRLSGNVSITFTINGKPIIVPIPGDLTPDEIAALIQQFNPAKK